MFTLLELYERSLQYIKDVRYLFRLNTEELRSQALAVKINTPETLAFFAPLYVSSVCQSKCGYCAFRVESKIKRRTLTYKEVQQEVSYLAKQGYDAVYCLSGSFVEGNINKHGSMTGVNARGLQAIHEAGLFPVLESSPFSKNNFKALIEIAGGVGRFVLFQECYDEESYQSLHSSDCFKSDPYKRLQQINLAIEAGWPEVGIGVLIGLHPDIEREIACLIAHYHLLNDKNVRKITISVPRVNEATSALLINK